MHPKIIVDTTSVWEGFPVVCTFKKKKKGLAEYSPLDYKPL